MGERPDAGAVTALPVHGPYTSEGKARPALTPHASGESNGNGHGNGHGKELEREPPIPAVVEKSPRPLSAREKKQQQRGVKRKPVPRAVDSEAAAAAGMPLLASSSSAGSAPNSPPVGAISSTPSTPGSPPVGAGSGEGSDAPVRPPRSGERRKKKRRQPTGQELEQASTLDLVQALSARGAGRPESGGAPPPGYEEA